MRIGCIGTERTAAFTAKLGALEEGRAQARRLSLSPTALRQRGIAVNEDGIARTAAQLLAYPEITLDRLSAIWPELAGISPDIAEQLEIDARYAGYVERQEADIRAFRKDEALQLAADLDYDAIGSLSTEIRSKLREARPASLGAAARIPGVTPAALVALLKHVRRREPVAA